VKIASACCNTFGSDTSGTGLKQLLAKLAELTGGLLF
jgi:hypothetical protein